MQDFGQDTQNDGFDPWDPSQTIATAWSSARQQRPNKARRTYGQRRRNHKTSSSSLIEKQRCNLFDSKNSIGATDTTVLTSSSSDSTNEKVDSFSFSNTNFIASDSYEPPPTRRDVPPLRPSKKAHRRAASAATLSYPPPIPKPTSLRRNSTIQNDGEIEEPPMFRRSSTSTSLSRSSMSSIDSSTFFDVKENSNPNFDLNEALSPPDLPVRKRVYARRRSMTNSVPRDSGLSNSHRRASMGNLGNASHRSASMGNLGNSPSTLFTEIARSGSVGGDIGSCWMNNLSKPSSLSPHKLPTAGVDLGEDSSPSARSVATSVGSSRKRGMTDEPSDHDDDLGSVTLFSVPRTSYSNNKATAAANRLFSPASDDTMNLGPAYVPLDLRYSDEGFQRKGRVMDLESDRENFDSDVEDDSSVESMSDSTDCEEDDTEHSSSDMSPNGASGGTTGVVTTKEEVLGTMSSYEDLKFLIRALRQERKRDAKKPLFGATHGCTITLPHHWGAERRINFIRWTSNNLGFSVRAAGNAVSFLQVPRPKGMEALALLESALILQKERERTGSLEATHESRGLKWATVKCTSDTPSALTSIIKEPPSAVHNVAAFDLAPVDDMLIDGINALSFKEKEASLTRHVTLDPQDSVARWDRRLNDMSPRVEISRPSMDSHCSSHFGAEQDFMVHLHGLSPANFKPSRPPKMSIGSTSSVVSNPRNVEKTPMSAGPSGPTNAQLSFDFVETPLMKQPSQGWGSRPIKGQDWGDSEKCSERTTKLNIKLMNTALREAGLESECEPLDDMSPMLPSRSSNLCLDLEAADLELSSNEDDCDEETDSFFPMVEKSLGGPSFDLMQDLPSAEKLRDIKRRNVSIAKHRRMSVCVSTAPPAAIPKRKSMFQSKGQSFVAPASEGLYQRDFFRADIGSQEPLASEQPLVEMLARQNLLQPIFGFLEGKELLTVIPLVCTGWSEAATDAYAGLVLASVGCQEVDSIGDDEDEHEADEPEPMNSIALSMQRSWKYLLTTFPYASFLSEGAFKRVYKVKNAVVGDVEAVSVMDVDLIESTGNKAVVGTELAVSVMLSSLARRGICPNFVVTRGVFTCPFEPPASHWGSAESKNHQVHIKSPKKKRLPREPSAKHRGNFQCIRMELCEEGDAEEYIKRQPNELISIEFARIILYQTAFALHAAGAKYSLKHYDMKLLNIFLATAQTSATGDVVLRYGLGSKTFAMRMPAENALIAKLADYGTADVKSETNGQPISLAQITTLENTPPDFFILGDHAKQGHAHDMFGLGLCMLHLFTGKAPYEEILEDVMCPPLFKELLRGMWEEESVSGFSVLRSVILSEVYKENGKIIEGEPDETFYHTFYRYLVLFGVPEEKFQRKEGAKVWKVIGEAIEASGNGRSGTSRRGKEASQFARDRRKYSLSHGTNKYIARARRNLESTPGGVQLLLSLVTFNPDKRASALDVLNSEFFDPLVESPGAKYRDCDDVRSFLAFSAF